MPVNEPVPAPGSEGVIPRRIGAWEQVAVIQKTAAEAIATIQNNASQAEARALEIMASKIPSQSMWYAAAKPFVQIGAWAIGMLALGPLFKWVMDYIKDEMWWLLLLILGILAASFAFFMFKKALK